MSDYHSEKITTNFTLKINRWGKLGRIGVTPEEVENGALATATNREREAFFAYAAMVVSAGTAIIAPLSGGLMCLYMFTLGFNLGLVLCMPFLVTTFIASRLDKKVKQCRVEATPVIFARRDLFISFMKAGFLGVFLVSTMLWLAS
jgi:hypothetical protein